MQYITTKDDTTYYSEDIPARELDITGKVILNLSTATVEEARKAISILRSCNLDTGMTLTLRHDEWKVDAAWFVNEFYGTVAPNKAELYIRGSENMVPYITLKFPIGGHGSPKPSVYLDGLAAMIMETTPRIHIQKSETADTRTCDYKNVSKETLLASSHQHIADVGKAILHFQSLLTKAAMEHDTDKITDIDSFHSDFQTGFKSTTWWDNHRKIHRHHINYEDGIPEDVNLIDVLEYIADCVMAGMARSGSVYSVALDPEVLMLAYRNTVSQLTAQVVVDAPNK